jgi:Na+/melibiose symporter-like transporter
MIYLFLAILGFITAKIAQKAGGNFTIWFLIGVLTGGWGILLALIYKFYKLKKT